MHSSLLKRCAFFVFHDIFHFLRFFRIVGFTIQAMKGMQFHTPDFLFFLYFMVSKAFLWRIRVLYLLKTNMATEEFPPRLPDKAPI